MFCFHRIILQTSTLLVAVSLAATSGCQIAGDLAPHTQPAVAGQGCQSVLAADAASVIATRPADDLPAQPATGRARPTSLVQTVAHEQPTDVAASLPTPEVLDTHGDAAAPDRQPTSPLQITDLESLALANNPVIARAAAQIQAAHGHWLQTGLPPNPRLGYVAEEVGAAGTSGRQGGFVGQQFMTAHKLSLNRSVASWQIEQAQQELEAERLRVLTDVRTAFYDVLVAQERQELAASLVGISEQAVQSAEALFKGEEVSKADPLRAHVESERARIVWENSQAELREAWRRLAAVTGVPDLKRCRLEGNLDSSTLEISWEASLQQVLTESPEVAGAIANVEAAQCAVRRACAEAMPNVEAAAVVMHDTANGDTLTGVEIGLPIPLIDRNQGGIMQAQGRAAAAQRDVDRVMLNLQTRLAEVFQRHDTARNQVDRYARKGGIIDSADQTLRLIRAGYEVEEFGLLDLLSAQRSYFEARLAYLDSLGLLWDSVMEIRGLTLQGSLADRSGP